MSLLVLQSLLGICTSNCNLGTCMFKKMKRVEIYLNKPSTKNLGQSGCDQIGYLYYFGYASIWFLIFSSFLFFGHEDRFLMLGMLKTRELILSYVLSGVSLCWFWVHLYLGLTRIGCSLSFLAWTCFGVKYPSLYINIPFHSVLCHFSSFSKMWLMHQVNVLVLDIYDVS